AQLRPLTHSNDLGQWVCFMATRMQSKASPLAQRHRSWLRPAGTGRSDCGESPSKLTTRLVLRCVPAAPSTASHLRQLARPSRLVALTMSASGMCGGICERGSYRSEVERLQASPSAEMDKCSPPVARRGQSSFGTRSPTDARSCTFVAEPRCEASPLAL